MKFRIQNHNPTFVLHREGEPSITVPHTQDGPGVVLELPTWAVDAIVWGNHGTPLRFVRVADDHPVHELDQRTGIRVAVRDRLDWPQDGFELAAGTTDHDSIAAWVATVPESVRPKLARFLRGDHVRVLDLSTNPVSSVTAAAMAALEAA
ncbi:MAG TPA: hypothetical protein VHB79_38805 [Polyangiaceae bacterium]|nr:hypothetical protein [Polyangiaceae bacterium]